MNKEYPSRRGPAAQPRQPLPLGLFISPFLFFVLCSLFAGPAQAQPFQSEDAHRGHLPNEHLVPVKPRPHELTSPTRLPVVRRVLRLDDSGRPVVQQGALSGVTVYLSPGHGWTYTSSTKWATQRGNTHSVVEDLSNGDMVGQFIVPRLLAAGALVVPVREIDATTQMVILDNSDGTKAKARGRYVESGAKFSDSTLKGWGHPALPITTAVNPFSIGGNRLVKTASSETARASFVPLVPAAGFYNVYISYSMYSARPSDARFSVLHPGGSTTFLVDQRRQGGTWVLLGRFWFDQGQDEKRGAVVVSNRSQDSGSYLSVDAVRLGGGLGLFNRGGGTSGQARADECSRYHAQFAGAPASVYNPSSGSDRTDDVSTRSRFADWAHAPGEPAVYISHHTNAYKGTARGSISFVYGKNAVDGSYKPTPTTLALGSDKLAFAVHNQLVADIRAAWDPGWQDRKVKSAYFGELNTANQDEMPAMLIETAFHDNSQDAAALKQARFRHIVGRAVTKGIIKYFAAKNGTTARYAPEPPRAVTARGSGKGQVTVSWAQPRFGGALGHAATDYRVYRGTHGMAFDNGTVAGGKTSLTLKGLAAGQVHYLRVTALNQGGESLPSPTLAVRPSASGGSAPLLLVTGSDRWDPDQNQVLPYPKLKTVHRLWPERINNGSYLVQHGRALSGVKQLAFDASSHDAVDSGAVKPKDYRLVLWQGGQGLSSGRALSVASRAALSQAASAGTSLVLSGSRLARTLGASSASAADRSFLAGAMFASHVSAASSQVAVTPRAGGVLAGLKPWTLATVHSGPYAVGLPDVIKPAAGFCAAQYKAGACAVTQRWTGKRCAVLLGAPLEGLLPVQRQAELVSRLLAYCKVPGPTPPPADGGPAPPDGAPAARDGLASLDGLADGSADGAPDPGEEADDGCGCVVAAGEPPAALVLLALVLLACWRRRRC